MDNAAWRVLIIGDSPEDRAEIRRLLLAGSERRYLFTESGTGSAEIRAHLAREDGPPDCAILDCQLLPDRDATEVLAALGGGEQPRCPVVMAGVAGRVESSAILRAGARDFVGKHWMNAESLARAVENAIERHALTRELRRSEARLRLAVQVANLATIEVDYATDTLRLSPEAATILGLPPTPAAVPRARVHGLFHPEDRDEIFAGLDRAMNPTLGWLAMEHRIVTPAGKVRWLSIREQIFFRRYPNGTRPESAILVIRDITDDKQAESRLEESRARLAGIVDTAMDAIVTVDSEQRVVLFNAAAEKIFRCPAAEAIGGPLERFIPEGVRASHREHLRNFASSGATQRALGRLGTLEGLRADGERFPVEASISRVEIGGESLFTVILRDITERKRAERERQKFVSLADNSEEFIGICDMGFLPTYANAAALRMVGLDSLEQTRRIPVPEFFFPEDQAYITEEFFPKVLREGRAEVEIRFRHFKTGAAIWMIYNVFYIRDTDGTPMGLATVSRDITDRKWGEAEIERLNGDLRSRVAELQAIFDTAPIGLAISEDPEGRKIRGNPANERMLGLPSGSELSKGAPRPAPYRVFQEGRELSLEELPMQRATRGETVVGQLIEVEKPGGEHIVLYCNASPLPDDNERPRGAVGAFLDITEIKRAEARFRLLAETAGCLLSEQAPRDRIDALCRKVMAHLGCQAFFNYLEDESTHRLRLYAHAGISEAEAAEIEWLDPGSAMGLAVAREGRGVAADEARKPPTDPRMAIAPRLGFRSFSRHPLLAGERLLGTLAFATKTREPFTEEEIDLTRAVADQVSVSMQSILAQQALRKSEERYRGLVEQTVDGIFVSDAQGRYVDVNSAGAAMLGYTREEILRLGIPDVIAPEELPRIAPEVARFADGRVVRSEWRFRRKDGTSFPGEIMGRQLPDGRLQAILRDIAKRKENEARLLEQAERLREADRRKDEFLAMLAHELRNPLAPIRNAVNLLKQPALGENELPWCRDIIERQIEQLTRLVDDLLDISRITRGRINLKKEPIELDGILRRAVEISRPSIEDHRHQLSLSLPSQPIRVLGDLVRLAQVVSNLLNNAAKFTDPGGRIDLVAERENDNVLIRVRDNGRGIDPSGLPGLFDLFYQVDQTLDRSKGGLGIGLSLVKQLVELHGGRVLAHSEGRGKGSEFVIRLPCLNDTPPSESAMDATADSLAGGDGIRVLIVDDNEDAAESLSLLLKLDGYEVLAAHEGHEAVRLALAFRPEIVLLDVGLPGLNGYEVCRHLRESGMADALIVAITGYGQEEDIRQAREAGFDAHRVKPVDPEAIRELLTAGRKTSG